MEAKQQRYVEKRLFNNHHCPICPQSFKQRKDAYKHIRNIHGEKVEEVMVKQEQKAKRQKKRVEKAEKKREAKQSTKPFDRQDRGQQDDSRHDMMTDDRQTMEQPMHEQSIDDDMMDVNHSEHLGMM